MLMENGDFSGQLSPAPNMWIQRKLLMTVYVQVCIGMRGHIYAHTASGNICRCICIIYTSDIGEHTHTSNKIDRYLSVKVIC